MDKERTFAVTIWDRTADRQRLSFDLADILSACGERAQTSSWLCHDVEALGSAAEELHAASDREVPIAGYELVRIAKRIDQTFDGCFEARTSFQESPWLFIRAVDGIEFVVVTREETIINSLRKRFKDVRESPLDTDYLRCRSR